MRQNQTQLANRRILKNRVERIPRWRKYLIAIILKFKVNDGTIDRRQMVLREINFFDSVGSACDEHVKHLEEDTLIVAVDSKESIGKV